MPSPALFKSCAIVSATAAALVLLAQLALTGYPHPETFPDAVALYTNPVYRAQAWGILVQVFCMFIALWGVAAAAGRTSPGLIWTGFLVFCFWQVFELLPRSLELWTLAYDWAPTYLAAQEPAGRSAVEGRIITLDGIISAIGGVRRQLWALGHLLFALVFLRGAGLERILGALFLLNAGRLIVRAVGEATGVTFLAQAFSGRIPFILGMVPLFALLAVWLWREASAAGRPAATPSVST